MIKKSILIFLLIQSICLCSCGIEKGSKNSDTEEGTSSNMITERKIEDVQDSYEEIKKDPESYEELTLDELKKINGGNIEIENDPDTDIPRSITGKFSSNTINTSEEALTALMGLRNIMKIEDDSFSCMDIDKDSTDLCVYTLCQLYNGVIVDEGIFKIAVNKEDGTPFSVRGKFMPGISIDTVPVLSSDEAKTKMNLTKKQKIAEDTLLIYSLSDNEYKLCWKYEIKAKDVTQNKSIYVDSTTGEIVNEIYTTIT